MSPALALSFEPSKVTDLHANKAVPINENVEHALVPRKGYHKLQSITLD